MSARAVVCPFCGVRQAGRDPVAAAPAERGEGKGLAGVSLSKDEVSALLTASDMASPRSAPGDAPGLFAGLVLPRPGVGGLALIIDALLIALSLPLTVGALAVVALSRGARRIAGLGRARRTGPVAAALLGICVGGPGAWAVLSLLDVSPAVRGAVIGVAAAALVVRTYLRLR